MLDTQTVKRTELQADCFAGLMFAAMNQHGMLEPGDVEETAKSIATFGDRH